MRIDIIVATYNSAEYIERCLFSIYKAASKSKRDVLNSVIIQDGCSSDNTLIIVKDFLGRLNIDLKSEKDLGVYDAWNKALRRATSDWILFLGSDDELVYNYFQIVDAFLSCNYNWITGKIRFGGTQIQGKPFDRNEFMLYMTSLHPGSLTRLDLLMPDGFETKYLAAGDYAFYARKIDYLNVAFVDEILVEMSSGGLSDSDKVLFETFTIRKEHFGMNFLCNYFLLMKSILGRRF
jgi:glycosyltransferase involved in cell wall biosynthesis